MAVSTINTVLKFGTDSSSLTKLCPIKSYPDLGGTPEQIETTDLDCDQQTFIPGVKSMDSMEFTANYDWDTYKTMKTNEGKAGHFELDFGENGEDGKFTWQGTYSVVPTGGDVNAAREMKITVTPSSKITPVTE